MLGSIGALLKGNLVSELSDLADDMFTSDEERLAFKQKAAEIADRAAARADELEGKRIEARGAVVLQEATSGVLKSNWRPATMIALVALLIAHCFGWTSRDLPEDVVIAVIELIQIGLGGYVIGRSAEKIAGPIAEAVRAGRERQLQAPPV